MSPADDDLSKQVASWITQDPDMKTRNQLIELLTSHRLGESEASARLSALFSGRLAFGTAGIRGPIRPGPGGMNRVVIGQTTAGLARYLHDNCDQSASHRLSVVVGCDARTNSDVFARDTASIFSGHGIDVIQLPDALPTPVLAFAVRHLEADAGVMVTASHNPPADNGYKVYLGGADEGSQIIPPVDANIEAHILDVASALPWNEIPNSPDNLTSAPESLVSDYIAGTLASIQLSGVVHEGFQAVYTPLHGVGAGTFLAAVEAAGLPAPQVVACQAQPDAAFPTVAFPNPEEKGALDLSFELAREITADLIVANDPDADRLAIALPDASSPAGYSALTGNQVGAILGWHMAERAATSGQQGALSNSLVSSPVLGKIATHFGLTHVETLTGFKYVSRVPNLIFGFEEALGFLVTPDVVRDKDGISAGLMMLDLAHILASEGQTLWNYLKNIEDAVGGFCSSQITIRLDPHSSKTPISELLRSEPPTHFGPRGISKIDDFLEGVADYPPEDILRYCLEDDSRVIVRPSGTEPKLKIYLDTTGPNHLFAREALTELENNLEALLGSMA